MTALAVEKEEGEDVVAETERAAAWEGGLERAVGVMDLAETEAEGAVAAVKVVAVVRISNTLESQAA